MKTKSLLLFTLSAALLPLAGHAKPEDAPRDGNGEPPTPGKIIKHMDTDGSGTISKEEAKGPLAKRFDEIDTDGNGELTKKELAASGKKMKEKVKEGKEKLKEADTDGNGAISLDEATAAGMDRLVEHFDKVDADGDGEVTREEMREMREMRKQAPKRNKDGQGDDA